MRKLYVIDGMKEKPDCKRCPCYHPDSMYGPAYCGLRTYIQNNFRLAPADPKECPIKQLVSTD